MRTYIRTPKSKFEATNYGDTNDEVDGQDTGADLHVFYFTTFILLSINLAFFVFRW